MAERQIGQISKIHHAAGCGRRGRPGALRLGGVPMPMRAGFDRDRAGRRIAAQSEISEQKEWGDLP